MKDNGHTNINCVEQFSNKNEVEELDEKKMDIQIMWKNLIKNWVSEIRLKKLVGKIRRINFQEKSL